MSHSTFRQIPRSAILDSIFLKKTSGQGIMDTWDLSFKRRKAHRDAKGTRAYAQGTRHKVKEQAFHRQDAPICLKSLQNNSRAYLIVKIKWYSSYNCIKDLKTRAYFSSFFSSLQKGWFFWSNYCWQTTTKIFPPISQKRKALGAQKADKMCTLCISLNPYNKSDFSKDSMRGP